MERPVPTCVATFGKYNAVESATSELSVGVNSLSLHFAPITQLSNDSRKIGPINYSAIQGKAVAIEGKCEITVENGIYKPINIRKHWPRFL